MNNKKSVKILVLTALFIALAFVVTKFVMVPLTIGYFNLGDCMILISSLFLPIGAVASVAIGPAIADLLSGPYAIYAPFTLFIKAFEGIIIFLVYNKMKVIKNDYARFLVGTILAVIIIPIGYFFTNWIVADLGGAIESFPNDCIQALASLVIANILYFPLKKVSLNVKD